tara:strand:+ start:498 stop:725 length:228 start_codon:yes stop_codon:yes gene_type:complete
MKGNSVKEINRTLVNNSEILNIRSTVNSNSKDQKGEPGNKGDIGSIGLQGDFGPPGIPVDKGLKEIKEYLVKLVI